MAFKLIGKNFTPPDVRAKVTGKAKYSEDFRADNMAFVKLLLSPMPNANITHIDTSEAERMPGVLGILTANDVPKIPEPQEQMLTNAPKYVGQPILAVAAVDEVSAADAIDKIKIDYQQLPFVTDPLVSLYPGGPDAYPAGNVVKAASQDVTEAPTSGGTLTSYKWNARDFAAAGEDKLPEGESLQQWSYGDVDGGFAQAALVLDESFVVDSNSHHSMEPRSCFSYWQGGKCYVHGSTQSQSFVHPMLAGMIGIPPQQLVYIAEFCGGGFGSKGSAYPTMVIPALMSKKINRPCMLRISRAEEYFVGSARGAFQGRVKLGFRADGRILAADLYIVQQAGSTAGFPDNVAAGQALSLVYSPIAMRWRGFNVIVNTPPCGPQRGPGQNQLAVAVEPLMDKAARALKLDRLHIREINAPDKNTPFAQTRQHLSSAYMREALAIGAAKFKWDEKIKRSGERNGSKVIGIGVGQAYHSAGFNGFDGLCRITPDGKLHVHTGVGNLGTYSYASTSRVAAEVLGYSWDNVIIERGDSSKGLPWNIGQFGSNTNFTMSRTNYAAAMDAKKKLQEIAAKDLGGKPEDYKLEDEKVVGNGKSMTFAQAAQRAIQLGGKYDGHETPPDIFFLTKDAVGVIVGTGLIGVAKDNLPLPDHVPALACGFMMIELDLETGQHKILEYVGTADCGTVVHPQGLQAQIRGAASMGIGFATLEGAVYDPQNGLPASVGLYQAKPPSYLDVPENMDALYVDKPDNDNPVGVKGIGEPIMGCAASALLCAIYDALGGKFYFNRTPLKADSILNALAGRPQAHKPLAVKTQ
ncbi:MAG: xanthine dehydrogenase family protein molybdopterin-binding subunit [Alphaproteobacteria bacterium]